jgi:hypothetical protein
MAKLPPGIWAASLLLLAGCALQHNADYSILVDGKRRGADAPVRAGGGWLALDAVGGHWELLPVGVFIRGFYDEKVDAKGQKTGVKISSKRPQAVALLRDRSLRAGRVDGVNLGVAGRVNLLGASNPSASVVFQADEYRFSAQAVKGDQRLCSVYVATNDSAPECVGSFEMEEEAKPESLFLLWAGDLNRDGIMDFLLMHYSETRSGQSFFLSSKGDRTYRKAGESFFKPLE